MPTSLRPRRIRLCAAPAPVSFLLKKNTAKPSIKAVFPGAQGGPLVYVIAAKAVCFLEALQPDFTFISNRSGQREALASSLQSRGFRVVSGGTDSHMLLIDVFAKGVKGKEAEKALDEAYITANKNTIPFDTNKPFNPSGIRLGSPAVTTRGFSEAEMKEVGRLIALVLDDFKSEQALSEARRGVKALTEKFPLYAWKQQTVATH